ncbi:hypothetical protein AB0F36_07785 [Streptomyces sp. NPDC029080]|uniref:hypothetical protein n=1 Tax=Streptomyces sp. NPDC029080 TaxID=3155017 RepID=UPI0033C48ED4
MKQTFTGAGYTIEKEIIDVLLEERPEISAEDIAEAGGGVVAVILQVQDRRRFNLRNMVRDLVRAGGRGIHVAAISLPTAQGRTWRVVPLNYLRDLADGLYDMKQQLRLEAALRANG